MKTITNMTNTNKEINREFIREFYRELDSISEKKWMSARMEQLIEERGSIRYFSVFRKEFISRYFPEARKSSGGSLLDDFKKIDAESDIPATLPA